MNLYDLTQQELQLQELLMSGDIDEEVFADTIEGIGIEDKISSYCYIIRNLTAHAEACKAEKMRLAEKQSAAENGATRLKAMLLDYMQQTDKAKVKAGTFSLTRGKTESVNVYDWTGLPEDVLTPQPPKVDKKALKDLIKNGSNFAGVEIITNEHITIR